MSRPAHRASIVLRNLVFAYPGCEPLWPPLSLSLPRGRYGLVGRNGAGKSTLLGLVDGALTPQGGVLQRSGEWLLLDEPTAHLNDAQRAALYRRIQRFPGGVLIASLDRELLQRLEDIVEITERGLRRYGGPYSFYEAQRRAEDIAASRLVATASSELTRERRGLAQAHERATRESAAGKRRAARTNVSRLARNAAKRSAQQSAGKRSQAAERRIATAESRLAFAQSAIREDRRIHIDLPHTAVHRSRPIACCKVDGISYELVGPQRVALTGRNERTVLLALAESARVKTALLDADLAFLDDCKTLAEAMRDEASHLREHERRVILGRLLFEQERGIARIGTLSSGERMRAALALLLWQPEPPAFLLLDEPTANLDAPSSRHLADVLRSFGGALAIVTHDRALLSALELE